MLFQKLHEIETRNGHMRLVKLFGMERLLASDNTEQSGAYMNGVWKTAYKALPRAYTPTSLLFLGVGTGGALNIAAKRFPRAHITGIEWDPTLLTLAKERLKQHKNITLIHAEAETWTQTMPHIDLACIDLFTGAEVAPCVHNTAFLLNVLNNAHTTLINVYTHTDILNNVDKLIAPAQGKRLQYYASTIGLYGSPHFCS